jgi:AcrR family transcriptional regulator
VDVVKPRREIYAETTRRVLLETGRQYFLERGFAAGSAEELVRAAGLSRGALYHHFGGKPGLFEAVFEGVAEEAGQRIGRAMAAVSGPAHEQVITGLEAFLDVCADPAYREIVLIQGPIALGRQRWREMEQRHLRVLLVDGTTTLIKTGYVHDRHSPELLAAALYGTLTELSMKIAEADDAVRARASAAHILRAFLAGVAT